MSQDDEIENCTHVVLHKMWHVIQQIHEELHTIHTQGVQIMSTLSDLQNQVAVLQKAQADEAARQTAQDAATAAQIVALQATIDALNAAGGLTPANQAILDSAVTGIQSVIDSLNAEQPTPPVAVR